MPLIPRIFPKLYLAAGLVLLASCSFSTPATPDAAPTNGAAQISTPTAPLPSPTAEIMVALVNAEGINQAAFHASLALFEAAQAESGTLLATPNAAQYVLDDMINRLLLSQAARQEGFSADESLIDERLAKVVAQAGGEQPFNEWLAVNGYSADLFRKELGLEIEAAWMRSQIFAGLPETAEQVLARQVLSYTSFEAERLYVQLKNGATFDTLVTNNDPQGLGFLGWFPRGYLLDKELEEAAFALQPGEFSKVIETRLGFHIIQVLERDPARKLSPDARLVLQGKLLEDWLAARRSQSQIEVFLP
ncbi:MAG: peptidylprolyl isomerase [Anaerolineae bacterium]|nr:peptidylprolyl isomerase [Anaerolineae bacterium]